MFKRNNLKWTKKIRLIPLLALLSFVITACTSSRTSNATLTDEKYSYSSYMSDRAIIKSYDQSQSFSKDIVLNEQELLLDSILTEIRNSQIAHYKSNHFFPPARNFYQSKSHIENNQLFKIIRQMPKGAALHVHTMAMGSADWVVTKAVETPNMYIFWEDILNGKDIKGQFNAYPEQDIPYGYKKVADLIAEDPSNYDIIKSLLTFDATVDQDSFDIWNDFEKIFQRMTGFMRYEPVFVDYLKHGFELLINDNVQHVELRMPFADNLYALSSKSIGIEKFVFYLNDALAHAKTIDPTFTAKIIHANLRFKDNNTIWRDMQSTLNHRSNHSEWLVGYDLVAEEDNGHSTLHHLNSFLKLDSLANKMNIDLPLFLHDGESNWVDNDNLYDAVLLNSRRIGHGFNLFRFPSLLKAVKTKDICIEINPLSNQILGYIRDLRMHPGQSYLSQGINCSISSDDPQIFQYEGLSYDYWSIYMAWNLTLRDLKKLSRNGIEYSALKSAEKEEALNTWNKKWNHFIIETLNKLN